MLEAQQVTPKHLVNLHHYRAQKRPPLNSILSQMNPLDYMPFTIISISQKPKSLLETFLLKRILKCT
jgi:hypothetical protein